MKIGVRKPSIKKSFKARTTGKAKRAVKKAVIPGYGKKGTGWIKDPKKAAYNKVYNKTTVSVTKLASSSNKKKQSNINDTTSNNNYSNINNSHSHINSSAYYIDLINSDGKIKSCKIGYSWTNLFFMFFTPLARGDFKNFFIQFFLIFVLSNLSSLLTTFAWLIIPAFYNKIYIKGLLNKGYKPKNNHSVELLNKLGFKFEQIQETTRDNSKYNTTTSSFTNFNDYYQNDDSIDNVDDLDISFTMTVNGREIVNDDIVINDIAPDGYYRIYKYEKVVGVTFDNRDVFVEQFTNGSNQKVILKKDRNNQYDENAIKVYGECIVKNELKSGELGHLSADLAAKLKDFDSIYGTVNAVKPPNKIRLDIWVNKDEYEIFNNYHEEAKKKFKFVEKGYKSNCKAMSYEEEKDIPNAIKYYEESISYNFDGNYPYDRLAILYRKNKDYDNEIRVLNKAIENFSLLEKTSPRGDIHPKLNKFKERLTRAEYLKHKNSNKIDRKNTKAVKEIKALKNTSTYISKNKSISITNLDSLNYDRIVSLDFETANNKRASVCSIGYVVEENGVIVKEEEIIVNPKAEFSNINVKIHRIKDADVQDAPTWDIVWTQIEEYITDSTLVIAHNLKSMELSCIRQECERYGMELPLFAKVQGHNNMTCDTLQLAKEKLPNLENYKLSTLADNFNIELEHHNALSDAKACLELFHHLKGDYATNV